MSDDLKKGTLQIGNKYKAVIEMPPNSDPNWTPPTAAQLQTALQAWLTMQYTPETTCTVTEVN